MGLKWGWQKVKGDHLQWGCYIHGVAVHFNVF